MFFLKSPKAPPPQTSLPRKPRLHLHSLHSVCTRLAGVGCYLEETREELLSVRGLPCAWPCVWLSANIHAIFGTPLLSGCCLSPSVHEPQPLSGSLPPCLELCSEVNRPFTNITIYVLYKSQDIKKWVSSDLSWVQRRIPQPRTIRRPHVNALRRRKVSFSSVVLKWHKGGCNQPLPKLRAESAPTAPSEWKAGCPGGAAGSQGVRDRLLKPEFAEARRWDDEPGCERDGVSDLKAGGHRE